VPVCSSGRPSGRLVPERHQRKLLEQNLGRQLAGVGRGSYSGATSTTSAPITLRPPSPRSNAKPSRASSPPTSGVPVPVHRRDRSHQRRPKCTRVGHRPPRGPPDDGRHTHLHEVFHVNDRHPGGVRELPEHVGEPRMPIWIVRSGSNTPSNTARRNGPPWWNFEPS